MPNNTARWLNFSLQQMAAESYLQGIDWHNDLQIKPRLLLGNNNPSGLNPLEAELTGKTRFTSVLADRFLARYEIVDHHANDATGFSATLLFDTQTNSYTLSFRSSEYAADADGGDRTRDIFGADAEIKNAGFAFAQLVSMTRYFDDLQQGKKSDGTIDPSLAAFLGNSQNQLNVTGYSLGGHLATVFTELYADRVAQTYTFNGAGRGEFGAVHFSSEAQEASRIREMLANLDARLQATDPLGSLFMSGASGDIYTDERYLVALDATKALYPTSGTQSLSGLIGGITRTDGAFAKVQQIFGHADTGQDVEVVANSGVHAEAIQVLIEGQPLVENVNIQNPWDSQYGNSHSIVLIVDSLALQELFQAVDPTLGQSQIEQILRAASDATAGVVGQSHVAEGDTLEVALDALRRVFLGDQVPSTDFNDNAGGFGDLGSRGEFYQHIQEVHAALTGAIYRIDSLVGQSATTIATISQQDGADDAMGIAYRYALKELNPFVVRGIDRDTTQALYGSRNTTGELALVDPESGIGELTPQYLTDRALFLVEKIKVNSSAISIPSLTHFKDFQALYEIGSASPLLPQVLFGSAGGETLDGSLFFEDYLYGGDGRDNLFGYGGRDYLEGNRDNDVLDGGIRADTMLGGTGDDTYIVDNSGDVVREYANSGVDGVHSSVTFTLDSQVEHLTLTGTDAINGIGNELSNTISGNSAKNVLNGGGGQDHLVGNGGNDAILGGAGDDILEGGIGFDTYIYHSGDGLDRIEDSDAQGQIIFDDHLLHGGIRRVGDGANTYTSLDGRTTYVMSGTDLLVNGVLIVNEGFQSGQMGIQLRDVSHLPSDAGAPVGPFGNVLVGDGGDEVLIATNPYSYAMYGNEGNDVLLSQVPSIHDSFSDLRDGGAGDDILFGAGGNDYLVGSSGNDYADLSDGDLFFGGDDNDIAVTDTEIANYAWTHIGDGAHYIDGGAGHDVLLGALGIDVLLGGAGDDVLRGENRPEGWIAKIYDENLTWNNFSMHAFVSTVGADDYLDGGAGNDFIVGDGGDDFLIGGEGDDTLHGESDFAQTLPGNDWLEGGAGHDRLFGGAGADLLSGGDGDDLMVGDYSDDPGDADVLDGGAGADELQGGGGDDILYGGIGMDRLGGFGGDDFLDGGADNDELQGGVGADSLWGGTGDDSLYGQEDDDSLFGDDGDDLLVGAEGRDTLFGGRGHDGLFGQDGDDLLAGEEGDDLVVGGLGNDELDGGEGIDDVQGRDGDDLVVGGAGDDALYGDGNDPTVLNLIGGNDTLAGDEGDDQLWGGAGQDQLFGGDGADQLVGDVGDDVLVGDAGNDSLFGDSLLFASQAGNDTLEGGEGNDVLQGGGGADSLEGGAGDDVLVGGLGDLPGTSSGEDDLHGGAGNDQLIGGDGRDSYRFNLGNGIDMVVDTAGEGNRLLFGPGILSDQLTFGIGFNDALVVRLGSTGDEVQIATFGTSFPAGPHPIDTFEFSDGAILTFEQLIARGFDLRGSMGDDQIFGTNQSDRISGGVGADVLSGLAGADQVSGDEGDDVLSGGEGDDVLFGGAGIDSLSGGVGDDVLTGGTGDDALLGGVGNDTYHFNLGDGVDSVGDRATVGELNRVMFGPGIIPASLKLQVESGQLRLPVGSNGDALLLGGNLEDVLGDRAVDRFEFVDGTVLTFHELVDRGIEVSGSDGEDQLVGTNLGDRILGGAGIDVLEGGAGSDRYVFEVGDGRDRVQDTSVTGEENEVLFGPGISPDQLALGLVHDPNLSNQHDLELKVGQTGDALVLDTFDATDVLGPKTIQTFRFSDGMSLTYDQLVARGFDVGGTDGDDRLVGTNLVDRVRAGNGNDTIQTASGDDILDGEGGDDRLQGGSGSDVYLFGVGSSRDIIVDTQGLGDTVRFSAGIAPADVSILRRGNDLVFALKNGIDELVVSNYFLSPAIRIEWVEFEDGTVWDQAVFGLGEGRSIVGTAQDDVLGGSDGNDLLDGGLGADRLTGGAGDDTYLVEDAGDVVVEVVAGGNDTVRSAIDYSLGAHVEGLSLTGSAAINGTGNELDNVLTGNLGVNVLLGGAGDDTYVIGEGDTVVERMNEGIDTVVTDQTYRLSDNVENVMLTGAGAITANGNGLDNVLTGNGSASELVGGAGNDTYIVNGLESVLEASGEGIDTVFSTRSARLGANVENLTLLDSEFAHLWTPYDVPLLEATGNVLDNVLVGHAGQNVIDGGDGADSLDGRGGADTLIGGAGSDTYLFGRGYGADLIVDAHVGEMDIVQMGAGLHPSDVEVLNPYGSDVILRVANTSDAVTLAGFFTGQQYQGKEVRFADGTVWDALTLQALAQAPPQTGQSIMGTNGHDTLTGGLNHDRISGFAGDDTLVGSGGDDQLFGYVEGGPSIGETVSTDRDLLEGGAGQDVLWGGIDDDVLDGGPGNDQLFGGAGRDTFVFERGWGQDSIAYYDFARLNDDDVHALDTVQFGSTIQPSDLVVSRDGLSLVLQVVGTADRLTIAPSRLSGTFPIEAVLFADGTTWSVTTLQQLADQSPILGTPFADLLSDDADSVASDTLDGLAGDDTLVSWSGDDTLLGRQGDDLYVLEGTDRAVTIQEVMGEGRDTVRTNASYALPMHVEDLQLMGAAYVGTGNGQANRITGTDQDNVLDGGDGHDTLIGGYVREIEGGTAFGEAGSDILIGGAGNDVLIPVGGIIDEFGAIRSVGEHPVSTPDDLLIGGQGDDLYILHHAGETLVETVDEGTDTVWSSIDYVLPDHVENLSLITAGVAIDAAGTGNELNNLLIGSMSINVLSGLGGNDTLMGGWDAATTEPFSESTLDDRVVDTLVGGAGDDTYILSGLSFRDGVPDQIVEAVNEGNDTVLASMSYTLGTHVENLTLRGAQAIDGVGNSSANVLVGNAAMNHLTGGAGNDRLEGGAGDDTYVFHLGDGVDTISDISRVAEGNRIRFGDGIALADLTFVQDQQLLTIQVGSGGEAIHLMDFDVSGVHGSLVVQTLEFADGSHVDLAEVLAPVPSGSAGPDTLTFGGGADVIDALAGDDVVDAGAGDDVLIGGLGNDTLIGGSGDDTYIFGIGDGTDMITDLAVAGGENQLQFGEGIDPAALSLGLGSLVIRVGGNGDAVHLTTFDPNNVYGSHDIESFRFADGRVLSYHDLLARGFDLAGSSGDDVLEGTNIVDRLNGLEGNDVLDAGDGDDSLDGGAGNDDVIGGAGADLLHGGDGADLLVGGAGNDTLQMTVDALWPSGFVSKNEGSPGTSGTGQTVDLLGKVRSFDVFQGGTGIDRLLGTSGGDAIALEDTLSPSFASAGPRLADIEIIDVGEGDDIVDLTTKRYAYGDVTLLGGAGNDVLWANAGNDVLLGGTGNDSLYGGAGVDELDGDAGADMLLGGKGYDTYIVDNEGDMVTEYVNEGTDTVQTVITYTLGANLERLTLTGSAAINGTGNALNNVLTGNSAANVLSGSDGNDTLDGGVGADTLIGGLGNDTYVVDHADDVVIEHAHEGTDTIQSSTSTTLSANLENLTLTGAQAINGVGNSLSNRLTGNSAANILIGSTGNDTYVVSTGDTIIEQAREGTDTVQSDVTWTLEANLEHLTLIGAAMSDATGNSLSNTLTGNAAANQLMGGIGNDRLRGGLGNDTYVIARGEGRDVISENDGTAGNSDTLLYDATINPLDLVLSRQVNDLRLSIHGGPDRVTIQNWFTAPTASQVETIQAGNGQMLLNTQVDQLIQAMATFSQQTGLTWDQAIDQRPQEVQTVLAANWH